MKHTQGPWKLVKTTTPGQFGVEYKIRNDDNYMICEIGPNSQDANAHLIAAAPEMLEALENLLNMCHNGAETFEDEQWLLSDVERVIKKAKGEL